MNHPVLGRALWVAAVTLAILSTPASAEWRSLTDVVLHPEPILELMPTPPVAQPSHEEILDDHVRGGRHWRVETEQGPVHVWIPAGYDAATAATVVFVHGYWIYVDEAWTSYRLPHQFALSGINAMFIAGGAPFGKNASIVWPSLTTLVATVKANVEVEMPAQRLVAIGHSGAYRTLANWLPNPALDTVVLLDALYGEYRFMPWLRESKTRRFVNIAYETGRYSDWLHRWLPSTTRVDGLPLTGFPDSRIIYAKTDVGHWALVTDGIALPLSLRAIGVPYVAHAPLELPLGLPLRCDLVADSGVDPFGATLADAVR